MFPILFNFGPVTIYSYGFFIALAYLGSAYLFWKEGKKQGYQEEKLLDFSIITLVAALIGGRILYVLINYEQFSNRLIKIVYFWEGGFAYYGSLMVVLLVGTYFIRKWRWSFLQIADIGALAGLVAIFFGKIGSFLSGNDYGTLTNLPWGFSFAYLEGKRHPVQLYEAFFAVIIFLFLFRKYKRRIGSNDFRSGEIFFYFLFFSNLGRFLLEFFRGDASYFFGVKLASFISLILAVLALFSLYFYQYRNLTEDKYKLKRYFFGFGRRKPQNKGV